MKIGPVTSPMMHPIGIAKEPNETAFAL